jgi:hypothetical protein
VPDKEIAGAILIGLILIERKLAEWRTATDDRVA